MEELTLDQLKSLEPDSIFARGEIRDVPGELNMAGSGNVLKWVAVRGGIHDWAIYCHWAIHSEEYVKDYGDKVRDSHHIRKLVPCTDEAFQMYRY